MSSDIEAALFEEKDRVYRMLSGIAESLTAAFFDVPAATSPSFEAAGGDILQHVLDYTRKALKAEKCALFLADLPATSLILERVSGEVDFAKLKDIATYDLRSTGPGTGVTPWVYQRKKPFNARNFDELRHNSEGRWKGNWDRLLYGGEHDARMKFQCVYMAPLMAGDRAIGVLKLENRLPGAPACFFDKHEERIIDMVAALTTNLVVSQRIERNRYDRILPRISSALVSHFDQPSSYEPLLEMCRATLNADICSLFLVDEEEGLALECIAGVAQEKKDQLRGLRYENYRTAAGLTPWILNKRSPFNVRSFPDLRGRSEGHHVGRWDRIVYEDRPHELFKSLYSVPLIIGEEPIGVFKLENKNVPPYYFTESDERLFDLIGRLIAVGVRYAKTREHEQYLLRMARNAEMWFLAAGVSHQFNGYLQRMLSTASAALQAKTRLSASKALQRIKEDVAEAAAMIESFQAFKEGTSEVTEFDLDAECRKIIAISQERFASHNVELRYTNDGVHTVRADISHLHSILINLITNALDSVVQVDRKRLVHLAVRAHDARAPQSFSIEVIDSGVGLPAKGANVLNTPFHSTKPKGMGVGLFIVQRIVSEMGGRISSTSPNEYQGATFKVTLPFECGSGG